MTRPKRALVPRAFVLLLFTLAACRRHGSESERAVASAAPSAPAAPASPSSTGTGLSPSPSAAAALDAEDASATATPAKPGTRAEEAAAALDASTMERFVFRELLVGGYTFNWRRTWILYRSERRARLDMLCQMGVEYVSLTGKENDESAWKEPVLLRYVGTREGKGTYRVELTTGMPLWPHWAIRRGVDVDLAPLDYNSHECSWVPETIVLSCRREPIPVLRVGASLIMDNASQGFFHWAPSTPEHVPGLRCEGVTNGRFEWPLVFVAPRSGAPGIEWAFQHDDAVQQGAYRWMPALK